MRNPNHSRFFTDVAKEMEAALIALKHSTKTSERLALIRELQSLLFLLGFTRIEKQHLVIPQRCWKTEALDEISATDDRKV